MVKFFYTNSPNQTRLFAKKLARNLLDKKSSPFKKNQKAFIIGLVGDLGCGKTAFLQGFVRGLGIKEKITSPTFIILKKFSIPNSNFQYFYHIDCYRINRSKEILSLGLNEIIDNPQNIIAIEWVDKISKVLPKKFLLFEFQFVGKNKRKIIIKNL